MAVPRAVRQPLPLVAVCLAVIAVLGIAVRGDNVVTRWDRDVVADVASDRSAGLVDVARALTNLGDGLVLAILLLLAGAVLTATRVLRPAAAFAPSLSLAAGAALAPLLKAIFERPRPPAALHEVVERTSGYPSGHSTQSAAGWLALGLVLTYAGARWSSRARGAGEPVGAEQARSSADPAETGDPTRLTTTEDSADRARLTTPLAVSPSGPGPARGRWPLVACGVIVVVVGVSRVVLSVHSPTDVLAGWLLGLSCAVVVVGLLARDGDGSASDGALAGASAPGVEVPHAGVEVSHSGVEVPDPEAPPAHPAAPGASDRVPPA